jgi:hypothetical protein
MNCRGAAVGNLHAPKLEPQIRCGRCRQGSYCQTNVPDRLRVKGQTMRLMTTGFLTAALVAGIAAASADAATKKKARSAPPGVAAIYPAPDRTVVRVNGVTRIIVNRRSYLDPGTEVSPHERSFQDYAFPTGGDPGRSSWFYGPDYRGAGHWPLPGPFDP